MWTLEKKKRAIAKHHGSKKFKTMNNQVSSFYNCVLNFQKNTYLYEQIYDGKN